MCDQINLFHKKNVLILFVTSAVVAVVVAIAYVSIFEQREWPWYNFPLPRQLPYDRCSERSIFVFD